eukprot:CAMPEP_0180646582 /NCGR_PEP_ID=MMETSP1037_2-20121125/49741_1 /TAXON_ID=632150 /ORGANISM="Azadinium spinosum, Strain 3D9" /LENGTH=51 /DNA_ID=CAMNT_0022670799 /DNA_START=67 /DNA_END=219 /DNA_ORIENTATION=+
MHPLPQGVKTSSLMLAAFLEERGNKKAAADAIKTIENDVRREPWAGGTVVW